MPKKLYEIKDFSGGLNAYADPRDIKDNEFSQNWNVIVDKNGVLRVVGSAVKDINASNIENPLFHAGYGLFQFAVDYGYNVFDGTFNYGFEQGTVAAVTGGSLTTKFDLEATSSVNTSNDDYYKGMTLFFYSATNNNGQSRIISAYDASEREVTLASATSGDITTDDKYMIFRWKSFDFTTETAGTEQNFITNGTTIGYATEMGAAPPGSGYSPDSDFYAVSKITANDNTSASGGYLEYIGEGESKLTLKAGVKYNLSFKCAFKYNWKNIVCAADENSDGSGTDNYVGLPPWIELYSETVTNGGSASNQSLNTGLNLMHDGNWAKKLDFIDGTTQNYLSNPTKNCLENGDFRAATSAHWTVVDPTLVTLNTSVADEDKYGGHAGTAQITTGAVSDLSNSGNSLYPAGYVKSDSMTLDVGSYYRINFIYKGSKGLRYAIYNSDDSQYLISWTNNGTKNTSSWEYPFQQTNANRKSTQYIYFYIPEVVGSATTKNIELRLNSGEDDSSVYVSGISIRKAYNDLVNMDYEKSEGSPFLTTTGTFYTYRTTFKIPSEYSDATDWVFRIHAGSWDYQDDAFSDSMSTTQEVYIDDIKMTDNNGDVFTLLSSNEQLNSKLLLNSQSQGSTWNNLFTYTETNAELNYNYSNGVLRVSDGNFKTNNPNKIFYYSKESNESNTWAKGWKTKDEFLLHAPTISGRSTLPEDALAATNPEASDIEVFDGITFINDLYDGLTYTSPGEWEDNGTSYMPAIETDWKLNELGPNSSTGIVTRYWWPCPEDEPNNYTPYEMWDSSGYIETEETKSKAPADKHHIVPAGFGASGSWDDEGGTRGGTMRLGESGLTSQALWPLKLIIKSDTVDDAIGMKQHAINQGYNFDDINDENYVSKLTIYKLEYDVDYELQGVYKGNSTGDADDLYFKERIVPWFDVQSGRIEGGLTGNLQDWINSKATTPLSANKFSNVGKASFNQDVRLNQVNDGTANYTSGNISIKSTRGFSSSETQNGKAVRINFSGEYTWDITSDDLVDVANGDDLVFTVADYLEPRFQNVFATGFGRSVGNIDNSQRSQAFLGHASNPDNPTGLYPFKPLPGGPQQDGTDSVFLPYTEDQISSSHEPDGIAGGELFAPCMYTNHNVSYLQDGFSQYSRYFINNLKVTFHSPEYREQLESAQNAGESLDNLIVRCSNNEIVTALNFKVPLDIAPSGWAERTFTIASSVVNQFGEESSLNIQESILPISGTFPPTVCPNVEVFVGKNIIGNDDITKTKIYMKDSESDIFYLQFYIDHKKGENGLLYSTVSGKSSTGIEYKDNSSDAYLYTLNHKYVKDFNEVNSYESETLVPQEDAIVPNNDNLKARYKCSIVANNRLYVANIKQADKIYGDRMLKSPPGKYGILPASNFIDVAINDGDEITALSFYKDRLMQFKKRKVFVINTSGDYEFLEDTFHNVGVQGQFSVTETPHGIVWANEDGCYLYDGKKLSNLIDNKIPKSEAYSNPGTLTNRWCANSSNGDCIVGFDKNNDTILVNFTRVNTDSANTPSGATYHFATKSWALLFGIWNDNPLYTQTGNMSNMITNTHGDVLFYHTSETSADIEKNINTIRKWNHGIDANLSTKTATFTTKDITFGDINVRKKIYKIYITYRVREENDALGVARSNVDSAINVLAAVNGSNDFNITFSTSSVFAFGQSVTAADGSTQTTCYGSSTLDETDSKWRTARLIPSTPSELNNISSLMLKLSGALPFDVEINDISISYRIKSIK